MDVGIRILEPRDIGTLNLYVPFSLADCVLEDLGYLLREKEIASAVFNEVLDVRSADGSDDIFYLAHNDDHVLTVHTIDVKNDIKPLTNFSGSTPNGFAVQLKREFCSRFEAPGEHYVRFRFKLKVDAAHVFSSDVSSEDGWILSSTTTSEITEIRINEARSIPESVSRFAKDNNWTMPEITAIHYFLVRDISFDLIASHANFRKIRRMEPEWDTYLGPDFPPGSARNMLIYHWRKANGGTDVGDFVTLAKFRRSKGNIALYILLVVALGSIGSGLHASLSRFLKRSADDATQLSTFRRFLFLPDGWEVAAATFWLGILVIGLALLAKKWPPRPGSD
ncbi:hypothetical protein ELI30_22840 [Rhizobium leguminosarum]|uniref:hypothetical protein n=1 Tax=Rhizobium leguminosarum TaxID=384 RepID=UPI00102F3FB9|nr:hypothetical protein [Rhizobium leguminosarum]TAV50965.1 hypothetical protein ELI32_23535 [Rhizobium leguminosarum]TAV60326.1 hypothetical protein ELI31_22060 [Rhizobium leguminosarum]TAV71373.1 hypothetical protein ELI30_22840 [Rhizobium leguminosarum]TAY69008.1 hypothetical protein ELH82_23825 [Rhizobium leguminosarum]